MESQGRRLTMGATTGQLEAVLKQEESPRVQHKTEQQKR
jgi:hypothetical protein